jgi:hypothetical protein
MVTDIPTLRRDMTPVIAAADDEALSLIGRSSRSIGGG